MTSIIDLKSGPPKKSYEYQLAAYRVMLKDIVDIRKLIQKPVDLEFDEIDHTYRIKNLYYPSVTEILRSVGLAEGIEYVSEDALFLGSAVHKAVQFRVKGTLDWETLDDQLKPYLESFDQFLKESEFIPEYVELPMVSVARGFAGSPDLIGYFVNDKKDSDDIKCYTLHLQKDGQIARLVPMKNIRAEQIFLSALMVHNAKIADGILKPGGSYARSSN